MATYPYGTASTGVFDIFNTNFSPNDVVKAIRDNYSPVNRTTMLNSLGYQVGLVQNFVNKSYLGRSDTPVEKAYFVSGWATGSLTSYSGDLLSSGDDYSATALYPEYLKVRKVSTPTYYQTLVACTGLYINVYGGFSCSLDTNELNLTSTNSYYENSIVSISGSFYDGSLDRIAARWSVRGTDVLLIGNDSDTGTYSGLTKLYGDSVEFYSESADFYFRSYTSQAIIRFEGSLAFIGADSPYTLISFGNNISPISPNSIYIGDETNQWSGIFSNTFYSQVVDSDYAYYLRTTVGAQNLYDSSEVYSFDTQFLNPPDVMSRTAIAPNYILLYSLTPAGSGYLYVGDLGHLWYYNLTSGSGTDLTP